MRFKYFGALAIAGATVLNTAASAELGPTVNDTTRSCEIHVWPADKNLAVIYYNPIFSGRDRAFVGTRGNPIVPKTLAPAEQLELIQQLNLPQLFNLPLPATIVPHNQQLEREEAMTGKRHSNSTSPCQAELIVQSVVYESADQVSRSLRVMMTYQVFSEGREAPVRRFSTSAKARLKKYPATKVEEIPAANAELEEAFRKAVMTFAGYANRAAGIAGTK